MLHRASSFHQDGTKNFDKSLADSRAIWTVNDQKRLVALDSLHNRMLEYHNNIHIKEDRREATINSSFSKDAAELTTELNMTTIVAQVTRFSATESQGERVTPTTLPQLMQYCSSLKSIYNKLDESFDEDDKQDFVWIHVQDLTAIESIAKILDMHELLMSGFYDLRAHSSFLPSIGELFISMVTSTMENYDFNMYKLFVYLSKRFIVTYETELLPDLNETETSIPDRVVSTVLQNPYRYRQRCLKLGTAYLFYELAINAIKLTDTALEFISYTLSYFNRIVHLNLLHRERLDLRIKMHVISSGVSLFRRSLEEANSLCNSLEEALMGQSLNNDFQSNFSTASQGQNSNSASSKRKRMALNRRKNQGSQFVSGLHDLLSPEILTNNHIPYFLDLGDTVLFTLTCLQHEIEEGILLESELDGTIQLRSVNTSMVLSLIATTFMPLTFLAGIFGMNFQENGGYSISLLNENYGPALFYAMCAASFVVTLSFFVYQGWVEMGIFGKIFKKIHRTKEAKIDDSKKVEQVDEKSEEALKRAEDEEKRRVEESMLRRSYSLNAHRMNFRSSNSIAAMPVRFSNFSVQSSNSSDSRYRNPLHVELSSRDLPTSPNLSTIDERENDD